MNQPSQMNKPNLDEPIVLSVLTHSAEVWKIGSPPPQLTNPPDPGMAAMTITSMVQLDDNSIEVYAYPTPGSELDTAKCGMVYTLPSLTVKVIGTIARFDIMQQMLEESKRDEPDEPEEAVLAPGVNGTAPVAAAS